jgi:hypothetical protein
MSVSLADRIAETAPRSELVDSIESLSCFADMTPAEWLAAVSSLHPVFTSDLAWLTRSERNWVFGAAKEHIKNALTKFYPGEYVEKVHLEPALDPFVKWLESLSDGEVVQFSWDVIAWRPSLGWTHAWYPVRRMQESGRLAGPASKENIETAVTIAEEAKAISSRPKGRWRFVQWDSDSRTYLESLEDSSYLVRAASAFAIGAMLWGCHSEGDGCGAPAGTEMLDFIQKQEQKRAGVAGPFLQGADWLSFVFDNEWLTPAGYDMRAWFLETLRTSAREPDVPHLISLESWAHEFFSCDAAAIDTMLDMGREHLAVLTATEEPRCIAQLMPLLTKMSQSSHRRCDPGVFESAAHTRGDELFR